MSAHEGKTRRLQLPCPVCGGTEFTWGDYATNNSYPRFLPPVEDWVYGSSPGIAIAHARLCDTCGNVQIGIRRYDER